MIKIDFRTVSNPPKGRVYELPDNETQWQEDLATTPLYDAGGELTAEKLSEITEIFNKAGALHVTNTGLDAFAPTEIPDEILEGLGFGETDQFQWGGQKSGRTVRAEASKAMRHTDEYPKELMLLPHNEILYQRSMPLRLMFYCGMPGEIGKGGRTFAHSALKTEEYIRQCGPEGTALLDKMREGGFTIETGFLDENHPAKAENYFRSWQDRFGTEDRDEALALCQASTGQFDECWWKDEGDGQYTLMTSINVPAFKTDERDGQSYFMFPRIALDEPSIQNGYRRYLIGNEELTKTETAILLQAFMATREGRYYAQGDMLLVDNIRYGHGRESYDGDRKIFVSMAGEFVTDDVAQATQKPAVAPKL